VKWVCGNGPLRGLCLVNESRATGVGGLCLMKVLKNTANIFSSIIYYHRRLRL
jgi:hypothetical protein